MSVDVTRIKPGDIILARFMRVGTEDGSPKAHRRHVVRPARVVEVYRKFCVALLYRGKAAVRETVRYDEIEALNPQDIDLERVPPIKRSDEDEPKPDVPFVEPIVPQESTAEPIRRSRPRTPVTEEEMERVVRLMNQGLGAVRIARELGVPVGRAQLIMSKVKERQISQEPDRQVVSSVDASSCTESSGASFPAINVDELVDALRPIIRETIQEELREAVTPLLDRVERMNVTITATADWARIRRELATVGGMINRALQRLESEVREVG